VQVVLIARFFFPDYSIARSLGHEYAVVFVVRERNRAKGRNRKGEMCEEDDLFIIQLSII
jgi:hypothetical protein